ncbi:N(6)-adenine-specific methyltransferase METTL4 [Papilio machaon]|uniref:N(6)-adenine-specific methyltransferase METTL4 n=1 Tax=Papilio machaon TaxID=76193 RepID=UPI001E663242|nr:N(6)-adenine-specific methyltransferase METTL4 [Papilio machaon]
MSVLFKKENFCALDHQGYISKTYEKVIITPDKFKSYALAGSIFSISNNFTSDLKSGNSRKRKKDKSIINQEASSVQIKFEKFLQFISIDVIEHFKQNYNLVDTSSVRNIAKKYFESTIFEHANISGGNDSNLPVKCKICDDYFLIPQNSRFLCGDIKDGCKKLHGNKYNIVIADPPWWNKYIRRLKAANSKLSYSMMYNEDIATIPVTNLFADNCLVAVWCTNSPSNVTALKELIFPNWGVEYVTTWYWLKVTRDLKPLCEFNTGCKKQPYERLIIGKVGDVKNIPEENLIVSVPSALHSHKPPLLDILSSYIAPEKPQALELFARYLLPNTTSIGYEPLKWQHISLFEVLDQNKTDLCALNEQNLT